MELEEKEGTGTPEVAEENVKVVEIADQDANLKEEDVENVKKAVEEKVMERHVLTPEQQDIFNQILKEAKMPFRLTDGKFTLGENELDIRYLSAKNRDQMFFREGVLTNVYLRSIQETLIDISRLLMIVLDKIGVDNIVEATDRVIEKVLKENKIREQLNLAGKTETEPKEEEQTETKA